MYVSPQSRDTALRCCFLCESYLSLPWDQCLGVVCLLSACNRLSWSRMLFLSGGAYRSFSVLAPGGISHSGPGGNRQFWPDENSQS